jgi:ketosteroid isomerase-like protein
MTRPTPGWGPSKARRRSGASWRTGVEAGRTIGTENEEILDLGHGVMLSLVRESGRLFGGKGRVEQRAAHLITWANGKIEWFKHYPDPDEARAAAERLAQERR